MSPAITQHPLTYRRGLLAALDSGFRLYRLRFKSWLFIVILTLLPIQVMNVVTLMTLRELAAMPRSGTVFDLVSPITISWRVSQPKEFLPITISGSAIEIVLSLIQSAWVSALVVLMLDNRMATLRNSLRVCFRRLPVLLVPQMLGQAILIGLFYTVEKINLQSDFASVLMVFGSLALIGLVCPWFYLNIPICTAEKRGIIGTLRRGFQLTRHNYWRLLGLNLLVELMLLVSVLVPMVVVIRFIRDAAITPSIRQIIQLAFLILTSAAISPLRSLIMTTIYLELRVRKEGLDIEHGLANLSYSASGLSRP